MKLLNQYTELCRSGVGSSFLYNQSPFGDFVFILQASDIKRPLKTFLVATYPLGKRDFTLTFSGAEGNWVQTNKQTFNDCFC